MIKENRMEKRAKGKNQRLRSGDFGQVCAVLGGQWGDEGKGKLVDILTPKYDIVVRATGGANAGHTIYVDRNQRSKIKDQKGKLKIKKAQKFVFHLVPAGMLHSDKVCVMGNGMVVHLPTLLEEIKTLKAAGVKIGKRILISDRSHVVFDYHKTIDRMQEERKGKKKVGTTMRGIGPAYSDKIARCGIRIGEMADWPAFVKRYNANLKMLKKMYGFSHNAAREQNELKKILRVIKPFIVDTSSFISDALARRKKVLLEGANGALLDIDHGTFPYVTSSNATIGGAIAGCGIAPQKITSVIGILKAYTTRVGAGPFPTELRNKLGGQIREAGGEFGSTTGRPRRCGWFDCVVARYSNRLNGVTAVNLTKIDVLSGLPRIKIGVAYRYKGRKLKDMPADISVLEKCTVDYIEVPGWMKNISGIHRFRDLPKSCQKYIKTIEKLIGVPIVFIGTGQRRDEMVSGIF